MPAEPLTAHEREEIRAGIEREETLTAIAERLGRNRTTVSREVNRNGGRDRYRACDAGRRAELQRARPKVAVLAADPVLAAHVEVRLGAKDSPMTIAVELAHGVFPDVVGRVSHEPLYREVHAQGRRTLPKGLHVNLHRARRCRKHRRRPGDVEPTKVGPLG